MTQWPRNRAAVAAMTAVVLVVVATTYFALKQGHSRPYDWPLADALPLPVVPPDNPMTSAKVELGRWLFYDVRLSGNRTMSCGTCHQQAFAFAEPRSVSLGSTGQPHPRNAMSLVNVAYASRLTWANPLLDKLEDQALIPLLGDDPVEMGMTGFETRIVDILASDTRYRPLVEEAFPTDADPFSLLNAVRAIAAFVRSIVSYNSPYDRYLRGDAQAMSPAAERGLELFFSERVECFHCHGGINFTDSSTHANASVDSVGFHNNGLYNLDGNGAYPENNTGLYDMTGQARDMGRFRAPSLRNIALTAPYMHDGSMATLEEVIDHYQRGGRLIEEGAQAGDGRLSPFKSEFVAGFDLTDAEHADLLAFLEALTDETAVTAERWSDPFAQ